MKTFGCSHNVSDSEYMQGVLASFGYSFTENKENADIWYFFFFCLYLWSYSNFKYFQG